MVFIGKMMIMYKYDKHHDDDDGDDNDINIYSTIE